jgi:hypothetical protein
VSEPRYVDLAEAARRLRVPVARVEDMLEVGDLSGARVGDVWLVERRGVEQRRLTVAPRGRPLAPHNAWAVLALLEGRRPALPEESLRFVRRHVDRPLAELAPALRQRSARQVTTTTVEFVASLGRHPNVVLGGALAARVHGLIEDPPGPPELYVRRCDAAGLLDDLRRGAGAREVVIHIVGDDLWPFERGERWVGPAVAVVDLWDAGYAGLAENRPLLRNRG